MPKSFEVVTSKNIPLPKTLNQSTGKISNHQTGFNDASWGGSTRAYVRGINANLSNKNFDKIIDRAMAFARKSQRATGASTETKTKTSAGDAIELDKRALISRAQMMRNTMVQMRRRIDSDISVSIHSSAPAFKLT